MSIYFSEEENKFDFAYRRKGENEYRIKSTL